MAEVQLFESEPLRLDARGDFFCGATRVEHPRILEMLRRGLVPLEGGGYGFQLGPRRVEVEVEDAPYIVWGLHDEDASGEEVLLLSLSNHSLERLDPRSLRYEGEVPYCQLANGAPARFSPTAALTLGHRLEADGEALVLRLGGARYELTGARL